ncbi:hypothetical protein ACF0H5_012735 [Mactra antiquata]
MAEFNHEFFDDQTKLSFFDNCMELFRFYFVKRGLLTEEESKSLFVERHNSGTNLIFRVGESQRSPDVFYFDAFCNDENSRSMFEAHIKPTFELSYDRYSNSRPNSNNNDSLLSNQEPLDNLPCFGQLSSHENVGQASDSVDCQGASASAGREIPEPSLIKERFNLTIDLDKNLKLVIHCRNKEIEENNINSIKVNYEKKSNKYHCILTKCIQFGAEKQQIDKIVLTNGEFQVVEQFEVLKITNAKCYIEELYIRGQSGAFGKRRVKKTESDGQQGGSNTFYRFMQCGKAIFKIDFYDFYVYEIDGIVNGPNSEASQWPWLNSSGRPDFPPLNDEVEYKDLIDSIQYGEDRDEFYKIFKLLTTGAFCEFTSSNKSVMQLCLALCYSEVIRNFKSFEWNNLLLDHLDDIVTATDLREVLIKHPMVTRGSFKKRRTGWKGHTKAADEKISGIAVCELTWWTYIYISLTVMSLVR